AARDKNVHVIGLSILSGSHVPLVRETMQRLRSAGLGHIPVLVGGIVPEADTLVLKQLGVAKIYTPKDFDLNRIMMDVVRLIGNRTDATHEEKRARGA
ncbi:MAG: cobalamin-dependent protein, partial [Rhizobiales bacterium]|nr:cobalamin-dependent protein [Hyphomicrobiales bacterium]